MISNDPEQRETGARITSGSARFAYAIVSAALIVFYGLWTLYGHWIGDFWEHAAVVRELAVHPTDPRHPLLLIPQSHAFFSPYLLAVGLLARFTGLHAIDALAVAAMINLTLLLTGFRLFVRELIPECDETVPAYALLLTIFFWPSATWGWSGFLHFGVLGHVLPYPSTFAIAIAFLFLTCMNRTLSSGKLNLVMLSAVMEAVIFLTHPTTAIFALVGASALTVQHSRFVDVRVALRGILVLTAGFALAMLWPYFSIVDLLTYNAPGFHEDSAVLYEAPWRKVLPALLALPFVAVVLMERLRNDMFDALSLMLAGTLLIYGLGYWTGQFGVGRIIAFAVSLTFIFFAVFLVRLQGKVKKGSRVSATVLAVVVVLAGVLNWNKLQIVGRQAILGATGRTVSYDAWRELSRFIGPYDVIAADLDTGWRVPAFAGKVVAWKHPVHWVDDMEQRRSDVDRFFSAETSFGKRVAIIRRWRIGYILINTAKGQRADAFRQFGPVVYDSPRLQLIAVDPPGSGIPKGYDID